MQHPGLYPVFPRLSDDQIIIDDSPIHRHDSVIPHLDHHRCLGASGDLECTGLWQKGHLGVLALIVFKEHQICATHTKTQLLVSQLFSCFTYGFHPCPWTQSRSRDLVE